MKRVPDTELTPNDEVPEETRRGRWKSAHRASKLNRPSLSLISQTKSRQRPLGPTWVGLIR